MILEETINKLLRDIINLLLSSPGYTIKANQQGAPVPQGSYGTVLVTMDKSLGWEQREYKDNTEDPDITETITGLRKIGISLQFFRDNAFNNGRKVRTGLLRERTQELFQQAGIGLMSRSEVRRIDEPRDTGWEERSQFDIVVSAVGTDTDIIRSILAIDISGEYQARGLKYNFNIEVQ